MKNCRECGAVIDGAVFSCPKCGKPQEPRSSASYYDDVLPEDTGQRSKKKAETGTGMKIGLTIFGVVLVIAACVAILSLL